MRPIGIHIAFDPAKDIGGHTAVAMVASDGRGKHATMIVKFAATDPNHSRASSEQLVGRALQEFGAKMDLHGLTWLAEPESESIAIPEHIKLDNQEQQP